MAKDHSYKPTIFVACSADNLPIARSLKKRIRLFANVIPWDKSPFPLGNILFDQVMKIPHEYDYCISIFGADREIIGSEFSHLTSENVIFEFGLFTGVMGTERSFVAFPEGERLKIGADLKGVISLRYSLREAGNPASVRFDPDGIGKLRSEIEKFGSSILEGYQTIVRFGNDRELDRRYVEKRLLKTEHASMFVKSVRSAMRLSDLPNFATIYCASLTTTQRPYFHMQHFEGGSLKCEIDNRKLLQSDRGPQEPDSEPSALMHWLDVRKYIYKIGEATKKAHKIGHSQVNLKPSNIFLNRNFEPFLTPRVRLDFLGGAEALSKLRSAALAVPNGQKLALEIEDLVYTAPECFGNSYSHGRDFAQADVYRLGILAYQMFTGRFPPVFYKFLPEEENLQKIVTQILNSGPSAFVNLPYIDHDSSEIPEKVNRVFQKMVRCDRGERYTTITEALRELKSVEDHVLVHVKESLARCKKRDDFLIAFYKEFRRSIGEERMNELFPTNDFSMQAKKLDSALSASIDFIYEYMSQIEFDRNNSFSGLARGHAEKHIDEHEYDKFSESLICTICDGENPYDPECLREDRRAVIRREWQLFLGMVVSYFKSEARRFNWHVA